MDVRQPHTTLSRPTDCMTVCYTISLWICRYYKNIAGERGLQSPWQDSISTYVGHRDVCWRTVPSANRFTTGNRDASHSLSPRFSPALPLYPNYLVAICRQRDADRFYYWPIYQRRQQLGRQSGATCDTGRIRSRRCGWTDYGALRVDCVRCGAVPGQAKLAVMTISISPPPHLASAYTVAAAALIGMDKILWFCSIVKSHFILYE